MSSPTLIVVGNNATSLDVLAEHIHVEWTRLQDIEVQRIQNRKNWIDTTIHLASHLAEARHQFADNQAFGFWLKQKNLEKINPHDRIALLGMAKDLVITREVLEKTERRSWQLIWKNELQTRLASISKTPQRTKSLKRAKPIPDAMREDATPREDGVWTPELVDKLAALWKSQALTMDQIAKRLSSSDRKLTRDAIKCAIRRYGIARNEPQPSAEPAWKSAKFGITRKEVDPDFKGTSLEFLATYGPVNLHTKIEIEAAQKQEILSAWLGWVTTLAKASKEIPESPDRETLTAWMKKAGKTEKLKTWLADIETAHESIVAFLEFVIKSEK